MLSSLCLATVHMILPAALQVGYNPDYLWLMQTMLRSNPQVRGRRKEVAVMRPALAVAAITAVSCMCQETIDKKRSRSAVAWQAALHALISYS